MRKLLSVKIKDSLFCFELRWVLRVILLTSMQEIPEAPPYYLGLLNLAGEAVPVLDLGERIGMVREKPYTLETPIIIVQNKEKKCGLIVDWVEGAVSVSEANLDLKLPMEIEEPIYQGSVNINNNLSLLFNMEYLIDHF